MYDLPIAIAMLLASGQLRASVEDLLIAGELSLSGKILPIRGSIALAIQARKNGLCRLLLPRKSAKEALLIEGVKIYAVETLREAVEFLKDPASLHPQSRENSPEKLAQNLMLDALDFNDVCGQDRVKRAAEIAVAGGHNLLMMGCPGVGKSMIAKRVPSIMPLPTLDELIEIHGIHSAAGMLQDSFQSQRPFRAPHHTISRYGLVGGGTQPRPGEISLAHHGVLFLDELAEFSRSTLETLRQPMDDGFVTISRSFGKINFPSSFTLLAAMNPCSCGYLGSKKHRCSCSLRQVHDYRSRISGPILDRMDLHIEVPSLAPEFLAGRSHGESSQQIRQRVEAARERQRSRFPGLNIPANSRIPERLLREICPLGEAEHLLLHQAMEQGSLSARAHGKILRVSRTIADLENRDRIGSNHLIEAIQYRALDW
jgi:magnesium chelatase family protein